MKILKIALWIGVGVVAGALLGLLLGALVMVLWNWLMPDLFGLGPITYWQGVGLYLLCHLLFKSHSHREHAHGGERREKHVHRFASRIRDRLGEADEPTPQET